MFDSIDRMHVSLPPDDDGMFGRECPIEACQSYFKIKPGTGIVQKGYMKCFCPYCGNEGVQTDFFTKAQIEYAKSIAIQRAQNEIGKMFQNWDRQLRSSTRNSFIKMKVNYKTSPRPIAYYVERELETHLTCESCSLQYAIYGKFAFCPDCGVDNTLQIFRANVSLVEKQLKQAIFQEDREFRDYLIHDALENVVSTFDSFGRNVISMTTKRFGTRTLNISFQNLERARAAIQTEFGFDIVDGLEETKWVVLQNGFQKRHLISHNDGVIDPSYVQLSRDETAVIGRKVTVGSEEVFGMLPSVETLAENLQSGLIKTRGPAHDGKNGGQVG